MKETIRHPQHQKPDSTSAKTCRVAVASKQNPPDQGAIPKAEISWRSRSVGCGKENLLGVVNVTNSQVITDLLVEQCQMHLENKNFVIYLLKHLAMHGSTGKGNISRTLISNSVADYMLSWNANLSSGSLCNRGEWDVITRMGFDPGNHNGLRRQCNPGPHAMNLMPPRVLTPALCSFPALCLGIIVTAALTPSSSDPRLGLTKAVFP